MKTTVIQLESHDDLISIKDKMAWSKSPRLVLVWPKRGKLLNKTADLELIQRVAHALGANLAIVTHNPVVIENALALEIPVFNSVPTAQKKHWRLIRKPKLATKDTQGYIYFLEQKETINQKKIRVDSSPRQRILAMILSVCSILALFIYIIPSATITLHPKTTLQGVQIKITASNDQSGINLAGGIPAIESIVEVSGELSGVSSGFVNLPITKAKGTVMFTNLTPDPISIPAGTVITTNSSELVYITTGKIVLPKGLNSTMTGLVEANVFGETGNIQKGEITGLEGELNLLVSVTNPEAITGGTSKSLPAPSSQDYQNLQIILSKDLKNKAGNSFAANLLPGQEIINESIAAEKIVINNQVNQIGGPSDTADLIMTVRFKALIFQSGDVDVLAARILDGSIPEGFQPIYESLQITKTSDITTESNGNAVWTINATREMARKWDPVLLAAAISGLRSNQAIRVIEETLPQSVPPEIQLFVKAWKWMPFLPNQISFSEAEVQ
jgi:hypothetical protein